VDLERVSSFLNWKEFEGLAQRAFEDSGYETKQNYRFTKPRMEIDLLAHRGDLAFAVDCKHWKRTAGRAAMQRVGERQIVRSLRLLESFTKVIPLVLTWHDEMLHVLENGVPVVPVHRLADFLLNWESSKDDILVLERTSGSMSQGILD
jgi:Holliday junction resolvase-like predicted endonuclease